MSETETKKQKMDMKQALTIVGAVVLVVAVGASIYFYKQYQHSQQLLQNPNLVAQQQTASLLTQVGKLIELPQNETPTIATVSDVSKLAGQPFFANAVNGDKVLIYTKAKEAILYDPIANKIITVAPVNLGNNTTVPTIVTPNPTVGSAEKVTHKATPTPTQ